MDQVSTVERPRRREYSAEFKAAVLEQCNQSGASRAAVAMGHGINPNVVHRWRREERQRLMLTDLQKGGSAFVPLQLQPTQDVALDPGQVKYASPLADESSGAQGIRIEIQRLGGAVTVTWPQQCASECSAWLREWLR
jgi:transposase-like protein